MGFLGKALAVLIGGAIVYMIILIAIVIIPIILTCVGIGLVIWLLMIAMEADEKTKKGG